jgi:hypothetical protein
MLADLRDRVRQGIAPPQEAWPDTDGPEVLALATHNPKNRTVSLIMDETTANIAQYAIAAYANDREAHVREVEQFGHTLPDAPDDEQTRIADYASDHLCRFFSNLQAIIGRACHVARSEGLVAFDHLYKAEYGRATRVESRSPVERGSSVPAFGFSLAISRLRCGVGLPENCDGPWIGRRDHRDNRLPGQMTTGVAWHNLRTDRSQAKANRSSISSTGDTYPKMAPILAVTPARKQPRVGPAQAVGVNPRPA